MNSTSTVRTGGYWLSPAIYAACAAAVMAWASAQGAETTGECSDWPAPCELTRHLHGLADDPITAHWSRDCLQLVHELCGDKVPSDARAGEILDELRTQSSMALAGAEQLRDQTLATQIRRANHALIRRIDIWREVLDARAPIAHSESTPRPRVANAIPSSRGSEALSPDGSNIVGKMEAEPSLGTISDLLGDLELYEKDGGYAMGSRIVAHVLQMQHTDDAATRRLANRVARQYQLPNLRVMVTKEFINKFLPAQRLRTEPVNDEVLGIEVRGQSQTETHLRVRMIPSRDRMALRLVTLGDVASVTESEQGPARLRSWGRTKFEIQKPIEFTINGLRAAKSQATVESHARLQDVETKLDFVPLVGGLVRNYARNEYESSRAEAEREVEAKVASQALARFDSELSPKIATANEKLKDVVLRRVRRLGLGPGLVTGNTTDDRLVLRARLGSSNQLGAHTPRPRDPEGALASVQIHETAVNNFFQQLGLDGEEFTLTELREHLAKKLDKQTPVEHRERDDNIVIVFAPRDAICVRFQEGRVELDINVDMVETEDDEFGSFRARIHFTVDTEANPPVLRRDGVVSLAGGGLGARGSIAIRSVFAKVFPRDQEWAIWPNKFFENAQLLDLGITRAIVQDGWGTLVVGKLPESKTPELTKARSHRKTERR